MARLTGIFSGDASTALNEVLSVEGMSGAIDAALADQAKRTLVELYQDLAPSEALTRALVSERDGNRDVAVMWSCIYQSICAEEAKPLGSAIVKL